MTSSDTDRCRDTEAPPLNPWDVMRRLFESEIDSSLVTDTLHQIIVTVGAGPRFAKAAFGPEDAEGMARWMDSEARRLFPGSDYAKRQA